MKRLAFTTICALALTEVAFAQGTLSWNAFIPSAITAQTNATVLSPIFGGSPVGGTAGAIAPGASGPTFYFELLYNTAFTGSQATAPTTIAGLSSWLDTGLTATNSLTPGRILPVNPTTAAVISDWAGGIGTLGGTTNNIMLVGWSANLGTSWSVVSGMLRNWDNAIANAYFGVSTTGYIVPNTGNPGAPVFGTTAFLNGLPIYSLNMQLYLIPLPEPGTIALVGLGGLSLLWFHRRKSP